MKGEAGILQNRVEVLTLEGCFGNPYERIGCQQNEQMERRRDPALHGERVGFEHRRQIIAEHRDQRAEES